MRRKHWPRHSGGLGLGLGVGGGGVGYLLNDSFLTDKAAGLVDGTAAEPGPGGNRGVNDTDTPKNMSITGGNLSFEAHSTPAYADPQILYSAISRALGRMFITEVTPAQTTGRLHFGFRNNGTGIPLSSSAFYLWSTSSRIYINVVANQIDTYAAASTLYAVILRLSGCYFLKRVSGKWYILFIEPAETAASICPFMGTAAAAGSYTSNFIRVPTMLWTPKPISADAFGSAWPTTDGGGLTGLEAGGSGKTWTTAVGATWSNAGGFAVNAPVAGVEQLINPNFELWDNGTASDWDFNSTNATKNNTDPQGGTFCQELQATARYGNISQTISSVIGTWYRGSIYVKGKTDNAGTIRCILIDGTTQFIIASNIFPASYTQYKGTFRAVDTDASIMVQDSALATWDVFLVDTASVKPLTTAELIQVIDNGVTDFYAEIDITAAAGFQAGIVFNYTDANNFEVVYLNMNDNKVYWDQCVAGTYTNINTSAAVTPGDGYKLAVRRIGTSLYYWYNNIYVHNNTIVSTLNTTSQGLFSTGNGATEVKFDNWKLYAVGSGGEYSLLDMFCN